MPRKRHSAEEIVAKLRQADVLLAQGQTGADVARVRGVTETELRDELLNGEIALFNDGGYFIRSLRDPGRDDVGNRTL